jgi:hypothetical protein
MGFLSGIFGGGDDEPEEPPIPVLDPRAQEFQDISYPAITRGLQGTGIYPEITRQKRQGMITATRGEFLETQRDLPGLLTRTIPQADIGVRDFIRKSIEAQFARRIQSIKEEDIGAEFEEKNIAQDLAFGALTTEKGIASQITNMFNESMLRRSGAPSFESELAGGLGGATGIIAGGYRKPKVPTQTPQAGYGGTGFLSGTSELTGYGGYGFSDYDYSNPAQSYGRTFSNLP